MLAKDWLRYRRALQPGATAGNGDPLWVHLCNRRERLQVNHSGPGVHCDWRWTSDLHACGVMKSWGRELADRAFECWPIEFAEQPALRGGESPEVSFIIAHGGNERVEHLGWTVRSILAQRGVAIECVVVEQNAVAFAEQRLPASVRVLHRPLPEGLGGWRKSWAFNQGARAARGKALVFHDGDIVCPADYARRVCRALEGRAVASVQRFLFNLDRATTEGLFRKEDWPSPFCPERVRQNWEGGTIAIRRDAFFELGGYDEAFVGWGGEDNEFFDRCTAVGHDRFGDVPFVHLWHRPQQDKDHSKNVNINTVLSARLQIPVKERIEELKRRRFGDTCRPDPVAGYRDDVS